ncbi:hypothetical protein ACUUMA_01805 [Paenarthrobacter nitroguajacolicus]|uniref:hypothetical protein n=1 Tax=Paenarthrobacter nitroguajacolicus TaxID=211146 RepID=UPI004055753C
MSSNSAALLSGATISTAVGTTISSAVVSAGDAIRATVRGALSTAISAAVGTTISTAVVSAGDAIRAAIRGALSTAISTAVGTTISTAVVSAGDAGRTAVRGAFLLAWILLWNGHASSRESNGVLRLRRSTPDSKPDDLHRHGS